jgi:hypothetical protein
VAHPQHRGRADAFSRHPRLDERHQPPLWNHPYRLRPLRPEPRLTGLIFPGLLHHDRFRSGQRLVSNAAVRHRDHGFTVALLHADLFPIRRHTGHQRQRLIVENAGPPSI